MLEKRELRIHLDRSQQPVACDVRGNRTDANGTFRLANISRSGMFLECPIEPAVSAGDQIQFSMRVDRDDEEVSGVARVRWVRPRDHGPYMPRGLGVQVLAFHENAERRYLEFLETCLVHLKITDLMEPNFVDLAPQTTVLEAVRRIRDRAAPCAIILDAKGGAAGIFTRSDLFRVVDEGDALARTVETAMTRDPVTISTDQSTDDAYSVMRYGSLNHLPVIEDGVVVGVLSTRDLVRFWAEFMDLQAKRLAKSYERAMSVIAHDLRTPLGLIKTTNLMLTTGAVTAQEYLGGGLGDSIDSSCEMMMGLIDDILDLSTLSTQGVRLNPTDVDLAEIGRKVHRWFEPAARSKRITLGLEISPGLPSITADPLRLEQILVNLVGNALKFTPEGGHVLLRLEQRHSRVAVSVIDDGPGIAPAERQLLFKEFARLSNRPTKGERSTGLGLAIVKRLIEAHGGSIEVVSELGHGSTFRMLLPIDAVQ